MKRGRVRTVLDRALEPLIFLFLAGIELLSRTLSRRFLSRLAQFISTALSPFTSTLAVRRNLAVLRLHLSQQPGRIPAEPARSPGTESFEHLLRQLLFLPRFAFGHEDRWLARSLRFEGLGYLKAARERGRGVVILTLHQGPWELLGVALARRGFILASFYYRPISRALGFFLKRWRTAAGVQLLGQRAGLRKCLSLLQKGHLVGFVADQDGSRDGTFTELFGQLVSIPRGPFSIALKSEADVLFTRVSWTEDRQIQIEFLPPLALQSVEREEQLREATEHWVSFVEKSVLACPTQWLLHHDRFKLRHIPRLEQKGLLARALAGERRIREQTFISIRREPLTEAPSPSQEKRRGPDPSLDGLDTTRAPHPDATVLALAFYIPLALPALMWMAWRGRLDTILAPATLAGLQLSLLLGVTLGAAVITLSVILNRRFHWARDLEVAFREILGPLQRSSVLVLAATSSIVEEILFRGALQPELGLVWASLLFGLVHFPMERRLLAWTPFAVAMGFLLGWQAEVTGGLVAPMVTHFLVNAVNLSRICPSGKRQEAAEEGGG